MAVDKFVKLVYSNIDNDVTTFTIAATGSQIVDVDMQLVFNAQFMVSAVYQATSSTSGLAINTNYGMGGVGTTNPIYDFTGKGIQACLGGTQQPTAIFSTNNDQVICATTPVNQVVATTSNTWFTLGNVLQSMSRFLRITITNTDPVNSVKIQIFADL